ncbi:MAG TPA: hypothetical protein VF808_00900 [Ktedonobacterales bacterium]
MAASAGQRRHVTIIDAGDGEDDALAWYRRLRRHPEFADTQTIFITSELSSFDLSQGGANTGVVLREPHALDEIVTLVLEALASDDDMRQAQ